MNNQPTFYWKPVLSEKDLPQQTPLWKICLKIEDKYKHYPAFMDASSIRDHLKVFGLTIFYLCPTAPALPVSSGLPSTDECTKFAEAMPNGLLIWDEVIELIKFCQTPVATN